MAEYELINTLSESKIFRSSSALSKFSDAEMRELFYGVFLSTVMLSLHEKTQYWAQEYAGKTVAFNNFNYFRASATDLYVLSYHVFGDHSILSASEQQKYIQILRGMARNNMSPQMISSFVLRAERKLGITNAMLKNIRRTVLAWDRTGESAQKNTAKQMVRIIRRHTMLAEVTPYLGVIAGGIAGSFGKAKTWAKRAAAVAGAGLAGLAIGLRYDPNKKWGLWDAYEMDEEPLEEAWLTDFDDLATELLEHDGLERVVSIEDSEHGITALVESATGVTYELNFRPTAK